MSRVPLAVLDLSPISEGSTATQALQNTIDLAQNAERWGYSRYWVAEHHFAAVASSSPAVLIGLIAAATNEIRVGSATVQIGHHTAAAVVRRSAPSTRSMRAASTSGLAVPDSGEPKQ
jgi:alkanesulfonate monooxygenase SsuD/methylene tetrahydromethanopterin reductase-like flavin-dependent oxidoreductase (luciferase family)